LLDHIPHLPSQQHPGVDALFAFFGGHPR
jgi:hypothetical protein